jgi:hypothetical protein
LLLLFFSIPVAWIADGLSSKDILSRGTIRKSFAMVAMFGPAVCLIGLSFTGCNQALSVVWLCLAVMISGAHNSGINVRMIIFCSLLIRF